MIKEDISVIEEILTEELEPDMYNVILHNDDYTPMDFVIVVLHQIFDKEFEESVQLTMNIHEQGKAIVGQYIEEIANDKQNLVMTIAQAEGHPLTCTIEKAPKNNNNNKKSII